MPNVVPPSLSPSDHNKRFVDAALAVSDDCIKVIALDGTLQYMSEGGQRVMEVDDFAAIKGCPWPDFWQDQGNVDAVAAIREAVAGRASRFTGFANTAKGNRRFWDVKVSPIFGEGGAVESILSVSKDITALKDFEEQQSLLRNELSHRIKNIISLVQAVASQTLKDGEELSTAKPAFMARLAALGRAHDLLMQSKHKVTTLRAVAETTAHELPSGKITFEGPEVRLSPRSGLAIALALHELTTNAAKYGALSTNEGSVSIAWDIAKADGDERIELTWTESGGPAVHEPLRRGFGSAMIERALTSYVSGEAEMDYRPTGLVFRLTAPLSALNEV